MTPNYIQERYNEFYYWLDKLSNTEIMDMLSDVKNKNISNKDFIARWGRQPYPLSNWKRDDPQRT